jgi:hypothetical protein
MDVGSALTNGAVSRTAKSCGPDIPTLVSSRRKRYPQATVAKTPGSPGRARSSLLKPLRAGMLGVSGKPVVTTLVCFLPFLHARLRVHWAPGIPHALFGRKRYSKLGRIAPRECGGVSRRHCERSEAIQLAKKAGLLRRFAPRNDGLCCLKIESATSSLRTQGPICGRPPCHKSFLGLIGSLASICPAC